MEEFEFEESGLERSQRRLYAYTTTVARKER